MKLLLFVAAILLANGYSKPAPRPEAKPDRFIIDRIVDVVREPEPVKEPPLITNAALIGGGLFNRGGCANGQCGPAEQPAAKAPAACADGSCSQGAATAERKVFRGRGNRGGRIRGLFCRGCG